MKNEIRLLNKKLRTEMDKSEVDSKSRMAAENFLASEIYKNSALVMPYMPIGNETDTSGIIKRAFDDCKKVAFPVTDSKSGEITAYYADADTLFVKGAFSVYEPDSAELADINEIDVVIVPGVAFDKSGARIGFGKGCYDRFLKHISAVKIGFCYEFQICDKIIADEHDINMDYLVTENGLIKCDE